MQPNAKNPPFPALARTLMLQGTASSVGKSLLTAGLCRIFHQDGLKVAPFKAQNMALNAAVTPAGGEFGRAQAVQAEAAGIAPTVEMNPILLKPEGGMRSQVMVLGRSIGSMTWSEYQQLRPELIRIVDDCIARLRREFQVVVIEGAGSPAEINLAGQDLVNMHVAAAAEAPVLMVADIDRGGVFAQLVGTMELLGGGGVPAGGAGVPARDRVAGFIINKFRGDPALLKTGLDYLETRYRVPVLGVVPFIPRLRIAEEDSVALEARSRYTTANSDQVQIAIVRLPGISNYDDFSALEHEPGVSVSYIDSPDNLAMADLAIVPGSKSTIRDLAWMRDHGMDRALQNRARAGALTLGICGGCQMLGTRIEDPDLIESSQREAPGLGMLPILTRFEGIKRTTQVRAEIAVESIFGTPRRTDFRTADFSLPTSPLLSFDAYEIHSGRTYALGGASAPFRIVSRNGQACDAKDGAISDSGTTIGTMLHGIFENEQLRSAMLAKLRKRKGLPALGEHLAVASREAEYDRLAAALRESLDIEAIKRIAGLS